MDEVVPVTLDHRPERLHERAMRRSGPHQQQAEQDVLTGQRNLDRVVPVAAGHARFRQHVARLMRDVAPASCRAA
jgi:hypothetical protein